MFVARNVVFIDDKMECGNQPETLPHVFCHCGPHATTHQLRHNYIVKRLVAATRLPGDLRVNQRVPGMGEDLTALLLGCDA